MAQDPGVADRDENHLHPDARFAFLRLREAMAALGHPIFLTDGLRDAKRQDWLYAQGRTRPGRRVTDAPAGKSWHETGRAFDVAFVPQGGLGPFAEGHPWTLLGANGKHLGLEWGGDWPQKKRDRPHFQMTGGLGLAEAIAEAKARRKKGGA